MSKLMRWIPATFIMLAIFIASSTPSTDIPDYGVWDTLVKKGGHMTGYGLLASAYWYGLGFDRKKSWLAWLLTILYAATDEFHQSFTPGRHPSPVDVLLFDGGGAALALALTHWIRKRGKSVGSQKKETSEA